MRATREASRGRRSWRWIALACLMGTVALAPSDARAESGTVPQRAAFRAAPDWTPPTTGAGYGVSPRIDLRGLLPPIGQQGNLQSCVGWTVGYALKSGQETVDQGWQPDHVSRQFSPAFLWNQLTGGVNQGTSLYKALELLQQQGCSTLRAMPVRRPQDTPSSDARREAQLFRIRRFGALRSAEAIKAALRQEHVVVLGIRTDPVFTAGLFDVFSRADRIKGEREARTQARYNPHRGHAIACVGYDDTRRAFLLMNSWGTTWGDRGYCWVSYDLMNAVPNAAPDALDRFVDEAYVAEDVRQKVGGPPPASRDVAAVGRSAYMGQQEGRPKWDLRVQVACSEATLRSIARVAWHWRDEQGKDAHQTVTDGNDAFGMTATVAGQGEITARGEVVFQDGTTRGIAHTFRLQRSERRSLRLEQVDRYVGRVGGTPTWEWTIRLTGNLVELGDVEAVTYHLHPTFPQPNPRITASPRNGFAYTTRGWGTFRVGATVHFADGATKTLHHDLKFTAPQVDQLVLKNTSRYAGFSDGQHWWYWAAFVVGPLDALNAIQQVTYHLHPTFPNPVRVVAQGADVGFPLETIGWGTFHIVADVLLRDGRVVRLEHDLAFEPAPAGAAPPKKGDEGPIRAPQK